MKKVLVIIACIAIICLTFLAGISFKSRNEDKKYNSKINPATDLMVDAIKGNDLDKQYTKTSEIYKKTTPRQSFLDTTGKLKDYTITSANFYTGSTDNIIIYDLSKGDSLASATVTTVFEDGKYKVTEVSIN